MTDDELAALRANIERCRRLINAVTDPVTREALQTYLSDLEQKLREGKAAPG